MKTRQESIDSLMHEFVARANALGLFSIVASTTGGGNKALFIGNTLAEVLGPFRDMECGWTQAQKEIGTAESRETCIAEWSDTWPPHPDWARVNPRPKLHHRTTKTTSYESGRLTDWYPGSARPRHEGTYSTTTDNKEEFASWSGGLWKTSHGRTPDYWRGIDVERNEDERERLASDLRGGGTSARAAIPLLQDAIARHALRASEGADAQREAEAVLVLYRIAQSTPSSSALLTEVETAYVGNLAVDSRGEFRIRKSMKDYWGYSPQEQDLCPVMV